MSIYEIIAPDGRKLEIEGDTPPSEQELDKIFTDLPQAGNNSNPENGGSVSQPLQGGVTKRRYLPGQEFWKGLGQGISALGVGLGKKVINPLRAKIGKTPLTDEELDEAYGVLDDDPETFAGKTGKFIGETVPYFLLPEAAPLKGAGALSKAGNAALTGGYQGAVIGGLESLKNKGDLSGTGQGALFGGALGAGLPALGNGLNKLVENPTVQKGLSGGLEILTSVPKKYTQRALKAELSGNSLLGGKFDAEKAYIPIERKLRTAIDRLPSKESYARSYSYLAKKAKEGTDKKLLEKNSELNGIIKNMPETASDISALRADIDEGLSRFQFGDVNPALDEAGGVIDKAKKQLGYETNAEVSPATLHGIKEELYDRANYNADAFGNYGNSGIKSVAADINNYLRKQNPAYKDVNDELRLLNSVKYDLGGPQGINRNTFGAKLKGIGSEKNALNNMDDRLKDLDTLLDPEYKFYKEAAELAKTQREQDEMLKLIGGQYQRNPRLLSNIQDEAREQALDELQRRTGVNFTDELEDIRAREALEQWFPGQGGGSGSGQGFGNLVRTALIGGAPTAAVMSRNPSALSGLLGVSPKFFAKGTIQNLGRLYRAADKVPSSAVLKLLYPSLYGMRQDY